MNDEFDTIWDFRESKEKRSGKGKRKRGLAEVVEAVVAVARDLVPNKCRMVTPALK